MMKSAAQQKAMKTQMNIIKTFLISSVCYVFCWSPTRVSYFLYNVRVIKSLAPETRYVTVFIAYLNVCLNPFIYAAKLHPVKKYLRQILYKRRSTESVDNETGVTIICNATAIQTTT